ncbi:hypothetical protein [Salidesulfovibrio brasiliensis]|uniref:hypothetical protein n=1 Tax=Salidesulfovibrio brasiliensis TaxID=221711 RepID=UPI0006D1F6B6|nr:hypothetical protein [Salidesulfovibrio brasiliensis]
MSNLSGLSSVIDRFIGLLRQHGRALLVLLLVDAMLALLTSVVVEHSLAMQGVDGDFSWPLTAFLAAKSFLWIAILIGCCIGLARGSVVLFPERPLRAYAVSLVRFCLAYYPVVYLVAYLSRYLAQFTMELWVSMAVYEALDLLVLYPVLRLGPAIAAPLAGDEVGVLHAWRMTRGRFLAFLLPLVPLEAARQALLYVFFLPEALGIALSSLSSVFWFVYCAVWYVSLMRWEKNEAGVE